MKPNTFKNQVTIEKTYEYIEKNVVKCNPIY